VSDVMIEQKTQTGFLKRPLTSLTVLLLLQLTLFYQTYWSMVEIWWRSETFAHGFFIFPISAYLIWRRRNSLNAVVILNDWRALVFLIGLSFFWLIAHAVDVLAVQQFAVVMMLPVLVWLCLGLRMLVALSFPLLFLLFAVPFGEFLVYPLRKLTAAFTVHAIRMVGIPVFWEGMYFTLPSGSWSVVEACSGFRYILASLTLGALYAYLSYHSIWRRAAFMLLALVVPIVANGLRAFMIVMIGHFSGMELAIGVDHLIYGWVWFGIVMFAMFWVGSFWQDKKPQTDTEKAPVDTLNQQTYRWRFIFPVALIVLILPGWIAMSGDEAPNEMLALELPKQAGEWQLMPGQTLSQWQPFYQGATQEVQASYSNGRETVGLNMAVFAGQQQGAELASSSHSLTESGQKVWKELSRLTRIEHFENYDIGLTQARIKSTQQSLLVWQWKYFDGTRTSNDLYLKALEAWTKLMGKPQQGAALIVFVENAGVSKDSESVAQKQLRGFVADFLPVLEAKFDQGH